MSLNRLRVRLVASDTRACASMLKAMIEIYSSKFCGYCFAAKRLLTSKGVVYKEYVVNADAKHRQQMLERSAGRHTVPQIFINDAHIGGYDDLVKLDRQNELDSLLSSASMH